MFPIPAAEHSEFDRVIAISRIAEQEVSQRPAYRGILARERAVEDQNAVGVQENRVETEARILGSVVIFTFDILRGKSLVIATPQAVEHHRVGFGVPEPALQPGASALDRRGLVPQAAGIGIARTRR